MPVKMVIIIGILASGIFLVLGQTPNGWRGSSEATIKDFPFLVSVCDGNEHICGGVIIDNYFILTAANCFRKTPDKIRTDLKVLAGPDDVPNSNYTGHFYDIFLIIFPDEISGYSPNLAVLKLTSKIEFSALRQPVNLPKRKHFKTYMTTTGWEESAHKNEQYKLKKFHLTVWSDTKFRNQSQYSQPIHPDQVYASCSSHRKGAASRMIYRGNPVFDYRKKCKKHTIVGIISTPPLELSETVIYISVYDHVSWIESVMEEFKNNTYDLSV